MIFFCLESAQCKVANSANLSFSLGLVAQLFGDALLSDISLGLPGRLLTCPQSLVAITSVTFSTLCASLLIYLCHLVNPHSSPSSNTFPFTDE